MNFEMTKSLKAMQDSILLLGLYIQNRPNTIEESNALYTSYFVGGIGDQAQSIEEYIVQLYEDCKIMFQVLMEPNEEIDKYADSTLGIFKSAERVGLFDCKRYTYINSSDPAKTPQSFIEWKRQYLYSLFSVVSMVLTNIRGKFSTEDPSHPYSDTLKKIFFDNIPIMNMFFKRIKGKKGANVVNEILALRDLEKMEQRDNVTNKLLFDEITKISPIGEISAFNTAFVLGPSNKAKNRRLQQIEEAKEVYKQILLHPNY